MRPYWGRIAQTLTTEYRCATELMRRGDTAFCPLAGQPQTRQKGIPMLMYGKEASNQKQEIDRQYHAIPN